MNGSDRVVQFVHIIRDLFSLQRADRFFVLYHLIRGSARVVSLYYFESWVPSTQSKPFSWRTDSLGRHRGYMALKGVLAKGYFTILILLCMLCFTHEMEQHTQMFGTYPRAKWTPILKNFLGS